MPSRTPKQARLFAAVAHGWKPDQFKGPPVSVAKEFNQADKGSGILSRHARGGLIAPPGLGVAPPMPVQAKSPLAGAINARGNAGRYAGGMGLAPARPPRVPIAGMLRNVDQKINSTKPLLRAMGGQIAAQSMPLDPKLMPVIQQALTHLKGLDASSASAVLRSSPEAMTHPHVARAARALQTAHGIAPATKTLNQLVSQAGSGSSGSPQQP